MNASAEKLNAVNIGSKSNIHHASHLLKAIAHPLRLKILCILASKTDVSVLDIVEQVGTSQSNISQHLSILRDKDILTSHKNANKVYYRFGDQKILNLIVALCETICRPVKR
jgi:ArsR family transcriptional regulator